MEHSFFSVLSVSTVQQSESAVPIHIPPVFWISFPFRSPQSVLNRVLCSMVTSHLSILYIVVYMSEKAMAPHSSTLAWRIPGTGEPGGLPSMGSHRVGHDWSDLAAAAAVAVYMSIPVSQFTYPHPLFVSMFVLYVCISIFIFQISSSVSFLDWHL